MSDSRYENLILENIEEGEVPIDIEIFNLVKNCFEMDTLIKKREYVNNIESHDKSFETSNTDFNDEGIKTTLPKFKLSSILKENVIFGARKLKLNLMRNLSQTTNQKYLKTQKTGIFLNDTGSQLKRNHSYDSQFFRE